MRELRPGDVVAGYRIEAVAGAGGMGIVYRAVQLRLQRVDALKVIAPELADEEEFRSRFERESRLAAQIEHPNVIPIYSAGEEDGLLYIAMRFVDGTDLRALLRDEGRIEPRRAAQIVAAVASALDIAHARGLVHRDVKPANVLLTRGAEGEHVYLTDFGLSKALAAAEGETKTGTFVGTVDYVSPEQVQGHRLDARSDVYSLGCTLFHMLTGSVPYPAGDFEPAKLVAHARDPVPSVLAVAPDLPQRFEAVIARAMAKRPEDRYPSAGDLGRAAVAAAERRDVAPAERSVARGAAAPQKSTLVGTTARSAQPAGVEEATTVEAPEPTRPTSPPASREPQPAPVSAARRSARRSRVLMGGLTGVATAAVVAVAIVASTAGSSKRSVPPPHPSGISVGHMPEGIAVGDGIVWVSNADDGTVTRIDASTGKVVGQPIKVGSTPQAIAVSDGTVWVTNYGDGTVDRIDAGTGQLVGQPITLGPAAVGMAVGQGSAWVSNTGDTIARIDTRTGSILSSSITVGSEPQAIALGGGSVWVTNGSSASVTRINSTTGNILDNAIVVGGTPEGVAVGQDRVWVANSGSNTVTRIDANTGSVVGQPIVVGSSPEAVAVGQGIVWVANSADSTVTRINASTGQVVGQPIHVGTDPESIAVGQGIVWVANRGANTVTRIDASSGRVLPAP